MKIKNLAFYGVMAAILGSVGTARADGAADSTIIASKGYVDAYAQKQADRVTKTWDDPTLTSTDKTSETLYPSMKTLNAAITNVTNNQAQSDWTETDADSPAYIRNKFADGTQTGTGVVKTVIQSGGTVTASAGTVDTAEITDGAVTKDKIGTGAVTYAKVNSAAKTEAQDLSEPGATLTRWDASTAPDNTFPTVKAVAQQISAANPESVSTNALAVPEADNPKLTKVSAIKGMVTTSGTDENNDNVNNNHRNNNLNAPDYASDQKVPSEKAVAAELRLKYDEALTRPVLQTGQTAFHAIGDGQSVGNNLGRLDALKEDKSNKQAAQVLGANETATRWSTTEQNEASAAFTSDTKYPTVKAVAQQIAASAVAPNPDGPITASTDHSIVTYNADGLVTGGISLPGLNDINAASGGSSGCDADNPCVLSYYVDNGTKYYKWTKMDIVDLDVVNDSNS